MAKKTTTTVGIEFNQHAVRGAKATCQKAGEETTFLLEQVEELRDDFSKEPALVKALRDMKQHLAKGGKAKITTCVAGKQIYVAQMPFRRLPAEEMKEALRFEVRKNLPFDVAASQVDYQVIDDYDKRTPKVNVLVTAVGLAILDSHLKILQKADIKPDIVDLLPLAASNALWAGKKELPPETAGAILYVAPGICTFVADGDEAQLFHRSIYFSAAEVFAEGDDHQVEPAERIRRIEALSEEVVRTLTFYRQSYSVGKYEGIYLMGEYSAVPELQEFLSQKTGIKIEPLNLAQQVESQKEQKEAGKFDLAVALAMRTDFV